MKKKKDAADERIVEDLKKTIPVLNYTPIDYTSSENWFNFVNVGLSEKVNEILNSTSPDEFTSDMMDPYIESMANHEINHLSKQFAEHLHSVTNHFGKVKGSIKVVEKNLKYLQNDLQCIDDELAKYVKIKTSQEERQNGKS